MKHWGNKNDGVARYVRPDGTTLVLTPTLMRAWCEAMVSPMMNICNWFCSEHIPSKIEGKASIYQPPPLQPFLSESSSGMFATVVPAVVPAMPSAAPSQSDICSLTEILKIVVGSRPTTEVLKTPQKCTRHHPSPSDIDRFLAYLDSHPELGVSQPWRLLSVLTDAEAGPDVLAELELHTLTHSPMKLKLGEVQHLKTGAKAWLAEPDDTRKIPRLAIPGTESPSNSGPSSTPSTNPAFATPGPSCSVRAALHGRRWLLLVWTTTTVIGRQ